MASASIGQVHRARLKTGRRAVVKVQHPGIEGTIRRDLDILGFLADIAEMNDALRRYQPVSVIREFSRTMLNELDFRRELRTCKPFGGTLPTTKRWFSPSRIPSWPAAGCLRWSFFKGCSVADEKELEKIEVDRQDSPRGANVFVQMIFRDGFYHADPHPGNFLLLPDGKIGLLDAGMVGRIDEKFRKQIEDILMAAATVTPSG